MLIGVVAHVNRVHLVDKLVRDIDPEVLKWDIGHPTIAGCAANHIRVLTSLARFARPTEWVIVLEDDAKPVPNFREQCSEALAQAESPLVGLYLGTGNPTGPTQQAIAPAVLEADKHGAHWITADWFLSTVGYALRAECLPSLLAHLDRTGGPVDNRINNWTHASAIETWYAQPSLVDHADEKSVIAAGGVPNMHKLMPRRAWRYGPRAEWRCSAIKMAQAQGWSPT